MSDVIGNDLSVIASGLTFYDRSTFLDVKKILTRYHLKNKVPRSVWKMVRLGVKGQVPETPKFSVIENYVIATNGDCVDAMAKYSRKLGFKTGVFCPLDGNSKNAASDVLIKFDYQMGSCIVFGGETTVVVRGKGRGGRNQELILNLINHLKCNKERIVFASVGTDGIDGNTEAAGAIADSNISSHNIGKYIIQNNSYMYFKKHGGLIFTGNTHTNLMDIGVILRK